MRPLVIKVRGVKETPPPTTQQQDKFWSNQTGSIKIDPESLHQFLNKRGYYSYKPKMMKGFILLKIEGNKSRIVASKEIRRFCWNYINYEYNFTNKNDKNQIIAEFQNRKSYFNEDNLELLPELDREEVKDTRDKSYLFFKDSVLEVSSTKLEVKEYAEINGLVFDSDTIKVNLKPLIKTGQSVIPENDLVGEFYEFIKDICKNSNRSSQENSFESITTYLGYLTHRYKDPSVAKAVILMDTYKDGTPNGRTGKGIISKSIGYVRNTVFVDGKKFNFKERFSLSGVDYSTSVIRIDDVRKNFDIEDIFPLITENAVTEKKYKDTQTIPYESSPKIVITTNYTVLGKGDSSRDRKAEFILADTYNADYSPYNKFGHLFFLDWTIEEWGKFYKFCIFCLQQFLKKGIVPQKLSVAERKLKMEATKEFIDFVNANVNPAEKTNKANFYELFYTKNPSHHKIEMTTFRNWLKYYADAYDFRFIESHSGNDNFFEYC